MTPRNSSDTRRGDIRSSFAEMATAISMTGGRGHAARVIADMVPLSPNDHVVDVGCGPGTAIREANRRGARATGIDPSGYMLRLARAITSMRRGTSVEFLEGSAEALPLPDRSATVLWALSSVHHWVDRGAGLAEAHRVLVPGGWILLAERAVAPG